MSEAARLKTLYRYDVMGTPSEAVFDDFAKLAAEICDAPIALVAFIDEERAWFKSHHGTEHVEADRCHTFCDHTIREQKVLVVPDARQDVRFKNNPFVLNDPYIRFYAGAPLIGAGGEHIGALCVMSPHPRGLSDRQCRSLESLAAVVMQTLEGRLQRNEQHNSAELLALLNNVATAANGDQGLDDTIRTCMEEVCRYTGGEIAHYFQIDAGTEIKDSGLWFMQDPAAYAPFKTLTEAVEFTHGVGLPGQVVETKAFVWTPKIQNDGAFPRAAVCQALGITSAFAFPVFVRGDVVGVFEFFFKKDMVVDDNLLKLAKHMGTQMGHVLRRRAVERALEKQREFQNAVVDNMGDGIVTCDAEGKLTFFNPAALNAYALGVNFNFEAERWMDHFKLLSGDGKRELAYEELPLIRAFKGEVVKDFEMIIEHNDGRRLSFLCNGRAMLGHHGELLGAAVVLTDVTEKKKVETRVKAQQRLLEVLIEASPVGISAVDENFKYTLWNPGTEKIYGYSKEEVLGTTGPNYGSLAGPEQLSRMSLAQGGVVQNQLERVRKDGRKVSVNIDVFPYFDGAGEVEGYMALTLDISDLKERERSLIEANRVLKSATDQKSAFLANMSHELRTPLNGVIGMAEILLDTSLDDDQRQYVEVLQQSADNLLKIISDILDFSKVEAGRLDLEEVPFDLDRILNEALGTVEVSAARKGLELKREISGLATNRFVGDPNRIRQVLLNILSNAIKFTESGFVRTSVKLEGAKEHTKIRIEVSDSGIGIAQDVLGNLFQAFSQADSSTTRNYGGTGLGLSISKRLIELMKGDMGVMSEVGKGSTFWFTLELPNGMRDEARLKEVLPRRSAPSSVQPLRVLVAEDDATNRAIALLMLEKLGITAEAVTSGDDALKALGKAQYDMVLMDCQMPGMDGYTASRAIRAHADFACMPIIALTAHALKGDREKCLAAGMSDFLSKPIKFEALEAAIQRNRLRKVGDGNGEKEAV